MAFEPGDVVLVKYPFTDLKGTKQRPAVVLSRHAYNEAAEDVLACAVTSNIKDTTHSVLLDHRRMKRGTLVKPSRAKVAKCFTLHRSLVVRRIGAVNDSDLDRIRDELRILLELA